MHGLFAVCLDYSYKCMAYSQYAWTTHKNAWPIRSMPGLLINMHGLFAVCLDYS